MRQIFKPKEYISPSVWMERHIRLDAKTSNIAGRYSFRSTPYLRGIVDDIENPRVRKVVIKKAAQLGLTQLANNLLLYYVCNFAFPLLMIMPSKEAAQQFCERSLLPSIHSSAVLKPYLTGNQDDIKKTEMLFNSCILRVIGAGSPSKLASNPAAVVIVDEVDKTEDFASQGEAPALELAEDRTISFPNDKKIVVLSTPTVASTSVVHAQYQLGSQSKYFVRCPHCQQEQVLHFEQIKWPSTCKLESGEWDIDQVERQAYYECENQGCKAQLTEQDKLDMVRNGVWKDTNPKPFPAEIRSYHISGLYSFNITFGALAKLFLLSKDDSGKLRNFYNSYLGECFEVRAATIKEQHINNLITASPSYEKGELLRKPALILLGADVQQSELWFATVAFYTDGSSSLVDYGQASTFADLYTVSSRQYAVRDTGEMFSPYKCVVDMAYAERKTETLDFCISSGFKFIPILGRTTAQGLLSLVRETTTPYKGYHIPTLHINDNDWKHHLFIRLIQQRQGRFYLPQSAASDIVLKTHLTAERLAERKQGSRTYYEWVTVNRDNHIADCIKYAIAYKSGFEQQIAVMADQERQPSVPASTAKRRQMVLKPVVGWD